MLDTKLRMIVQSVDAPNLNPTGFRFVHPRIRGINGLNPPELQRALQQRDVASEVGGVFHGSPGATAGF